MDSAADCFFGCHYFAFRCRAPDFRSLGSCWTPLVSNAVGAGIAELLTFACAWRSLLPKLRLLSGREPSDPDSQLDFLELLFATDVAILGTHCPTSPVPSYAAPIHGGASLIGQLVSGRPLALLLSFVSS